MSEKSILLEHLKKLHEAKAWHGPSTREILDSITPSQAAARPMKGHSIWELVLHIAAWENMFCRKLHGSSEVQPAEGDFPPVKEATPENWSEAIRTLETAHKQLMETVAQMEESRLAETVVGKDYSIRFMLVGLIEHHVYHAGQISMLKKWVQAS